MNWITKLEIFRDFASGHFFTVMWTAAFAFAGGMWLMFFRFPDYIRSGNYGAALLCLAALAVSIIFVTICIMSV